MIKPEGDKFRLYTRDGSRPLGPPESKEEAEARERQVRCYTQLRKDDGYTGVMIGLAMPPDVAEKLVQPGGLPAEMLHCTLAYLGRAENLPADAAARAKDAVGRVCAEFGPFVGLLGGVGRFNPSPTSDGLAVVHATLDASMLPALREALVRELEVSELTPSREHGFDPHVTLRYEAQLVETGVVQTSALPQVATTPAVFPALTVWAGEVRTDIPLAGSRIVKADATDEEIEAAERAVALERYGEAGVAALENAEARFGELVAKGVTEEAAWARLANELIDAGVEKLSAIACARAAQEVWKGDPSKLSREYLEEAWALARERLPPWAWAVIHDQAKPRSGGRARGRLRREAAEAAKPPTVPEVVASEMEVEKGERRVQVVKGLAVPEKQIVYGVVLDPYAVDAHNDWTSPGEVEKTAHGWLAKYRDVPLLHPTDAGYRPGVGQVVESWLEVYPTAADYAAAMLGAPHTIWSRQFGADEVHSGTWLIGVKLPDDVWAAYQRGELDAFSIQGFGMRMPTTRAAMPAATVVRLTPAVAAG